MARTILSLPKVKARPYGLMKPMCALWAEPLRVRGVTLESEEDKVIGMVCISREMPICWWYQKRVMANVRLLTITELPAGVEKGVKTINITEKTGKLVAIKEVVDNDDLMIINKSGISIRISVE
jgi:DNA gyrase subunit A